MNTTNILCVKQNLRKYPINISFLWNKSYDLKHQRNRWGQTLRPEKSGINLNLFSEICKWKNGRKLLNMRKDMLFRKGETWKRSLIWFWICSCSSSIPSLSLNENKTSTFQTFELLGQNGGESIKVGWNFGGNTAYIHLS